MTRLLAIIGAIFCIGMIYPVAATEHVRGEIDLQTAMVHAVSGVILLVSLVLYCGFAALHSVSHVQDPGDRVGWMILTLGLNVAGSLIYYLTKYQDFRLNGMGRLIRPRNTIDPSFYRASPSELGKPDKPCDAVGDNAPH